MKILLTILKVSVQFIILIPKQEFKNNGNQPIDHCNVPLTLDQQFQKVCQSKKNDSNKQWMKDQNIIVNDQLELISITK